MHGWGELFSQQAQGLVEQTHAIAGGAGLPAGELALQEGGAGDVQMGKVPSLGKLPDQQSGCNGTAAEAFWIISVSTLLSLMRAAYR